VKIVEDICFRLEVCEDEKKLKEADFALYYLYFLVWSLFIGVFICYN